MRRILSHLVALSVCTLFIDCSGSGNDGAGNTPTGGSGGAQTGGAPSSGGVASGGAPSSGGQNPATGGSASGATSNASGGMTSTGGSSASGGSAGTFTGGANGGSTAKGGAANGGDSGSGGKMAGGGSTASGGSGGAAAGSANGGAMAGGAGGSGGGAAGGSGTTPSAGCGKAPTLVSSGGNNFMPNTVMVGGMSRQYVLRRPQNYDNMKPYRLILDLHGYGGSYSETAGNYFGLWNLSKDSTIFIALSAPGGDWRTGDNLAYVDEVLKAVEADLCIDQSRIMLEGFSQGAAMSWSLACSRPGVFRAIVGHSGGGVTNPSSCKPIPYLGSGGLQENVTQTTQSDQFAKWNGCTVSTLPTAKTGSHVCTDYMGCPATAPVRWCSYDGPHTPSPSDSGQGMSWMPQEVWTFFSKF